MGARALPIVAVSAALAGAGDPKSPPAAGAGVAPKSPPGLAGVGAPNNPPAGAMAVRISQS